MKNYKVITMSDRDSGVVLYYAILFKSESKWYGLAEGNEPMKFHTKKEARQYGELHYDSKFETVV
jgi:hypothetical protein